MKNKIIQFRAVDILPNEIARKRIDIALSEAINWIEQNKINDIQYEFVEFLNSKKFPLFLLREIKVHDKPNHRKTRPTEDTKPTKNTVDDFEVLGSNDPYKNKSINNLKSKNKGSRDIEFEKYIINKMGNSYYTRARNQMKIVGINDLREIETDIYKEYLSKS